MDQRHVSVKNHFHEIIPEIAKNAMYLDRFHGNVMLVSLRLMIFRDSALCSSLNIVLSNRRFKEKWNKLYADCFLSEHTFVMYLRYSFAMNRANK